MSSEDTNNFEKNCSLNDESDTSHSSKSFVIPNKNPLKIKLKINKKTIEHSGNNNSSLETHIKPEKNDLNKKINATYIEEFEKEEIVASESREINNTNEGPKMKLRSTKDTEFEVELKNKEICEGKKKKHDICCDSNLKRSKRQRKLSKVIYQDSSDKIDGINKKIQKKEENVVNVSKKIEVTEDSIRVNKESFCWTCHKDGSVVKCDTCPRVFHLKCVSLSKDPSKNWICPECSLVLHAEKMSTRSEAMKSLSLDQLCTLLNFAIGRMKNVPESQVFWKPVDPKEVPAYDKYITNPMDLNLLERNMKAKMYGSPQAFLADTKWLLHNSIIFNSTQSPLTSTARFLVKICRQEMAEIENCPDCYLNAHTKEDWFTEVCRKPHILIWARLKGFPFWPAKAMSTNLKTQQVDARFFGAHDKAWVPVKECYLYSKGSPQIFSKKRSDLDDAFLEAENYIKKIRQIYGTFSYAPDKTPFVPEIYDKQLQSLIPNYKEEKQLKKKRKSEIKTENDWVENKCNKSVKKVESDTTAQYCKLKRFDCEEINKSGEEFCVVNKDYESKEEISSEICKISEAVENKISQELEICGRHNEINEEQIQENCTDLQENLCLPILEHSYSPETDSLNEKCSTVSECQSANEIIEKSEHVEEQQKEKICENELIINNDEGPDNVDNRCLIDDINLISNEEKTLKKINVHKVNSEHCEVSSTSVDLKITENSNSINIVDTTESTTLAVNDNSCESERKNLSLNISDALVENVSNFETLKQTEEQVPKSFVNLSCDQKQKIINEAKLLATLDEITALEKQKVLNDLGLDASTIDIRQLAQENREILEILSKKCQDFSEQIGEVDIKTESSEKYLKKENDVTDIAENLNFITSKIGSIKVKNVNNLFEKNCGSTKKNSTSQLLQIKDVRSLQNSKYNYEVNAKVEKSFNDSIQPKKLKLEPVVQLIKIDPCNKTIKKFANKIKLSDEVSLLMVDGSKIPNSSGNQNRTEVKKKHCKKNIKSRMRKSIANAIKSASDFSTKSSKNLNVISVDTENSTAQKNLLRSLRSEEKMVDEGNKNVLNSVSEIDVEKINYSEMSTKNSMKELTIEPIKNIENESEQITRDNIVSQKNLTVVANSHFLLTTSRSPVVSGQNNQPNLTFAQNNLGQLSLVHLSNMTNGIQTNFVNLSNETVGFNNSTGTLYASQGLNPNFPSNSGLGSVIFTPSLGSNIQTSLSTVNSGAKGTKICSDSQKFSTNRVDSSKPGILLKNNTDLGLIASQNNKFSPLIAVPGEEITLSGEVGSVTAELNKYSVKMADYMKTAIENLLRELSNQGSLEAKYKLLILEMEKLQWKHQQEISELKQRSEKTLMELRNTLQMDKQKALDELKGHLESHYQKVINETKRKQWCANCGKEALFYCCWNTSYCDYPCQQQHWPGHMSTCAQLGNNVSIGSTTNSQMQAKPCK